MKSVSASISAAIVMVLAACQIVGLPAQTPATLSAPATRCTIQMEQAVSISLGHAASLAPDAFISTSRVFIEHRQPHDTTGRQLDGRSLERPRAYQLIRTGDKCVLVDEQSAHRTELPACECRAMTP